MDEDSIKRVREVCALIGGTPCTDGKTDKCDPDNCYIYELLEIGRTDTAVKS